MTHEVRDRFLKYAEAGDRNGLWWWRKGLVYRHVDGPASPFCLATQVPADGRCKPEVIEEGGAQVQ